MIGVLGALGSVSLLAAARRLEGGRATLSRARSLLLDGDLDGAVDAFARARKELADADANANGPLVDLLALVPLAGRTPDALRHLTSAAEEVAEAGWVATREVARLPHGLSSLGLSQGTLPLAAIRGLAPTVHRVRDMVEHARGEAELAATSLVPGRVAEAGDRAREELGRLESIVRGVDEMVSVVPAFAGAAGPRRYFLAAQTPAELRGTGGFIGSYAILTMDEGAIRLGRFRTIHSLPNLSDGAPATWPSPEVEAAFGSFDSAEVWTMTNVPPDAPTAGALIRGLWESTGRRPLDGVIFVDVQALASLLGPLGSVDVPGVDQALTPDTVVPFVTSEAYRLYPISAKRKDFLGVVGQEIFGRFLDQSSGEDVVRALVSAVADNHILLNAADPEIQSALEAAGVAGALGGTAEQTLAVSVNNLGANKLDIYLHQDVVWDVSLRPDGRASVHSVVELRNTAPPGSDPSVVLGPSDDPGLAGFDLAPGETYLQTFVYCGPRCHLVAASSGGEPLALQSLPWKGLEMYSTSLRIGPGGSRELELDFEIDGAWNGDDATGTYRLDVKGQPLLHPATSTISVSPPEGMSIDWASEGASLGPRGASWTGQLGAGRTIELRFQRGFLGRLWAAISS